MLNRQYSNERWKKKFKIGQHFLQKSIIISSLFVDISNLQYLFLSFLLLFQS